MDLGSRILKVNHAGEFGAISIYTGQIVVARLFARDLVPELVEFRSHERGHREIFRAELERRGRPRCKSYWLCGFGDSGDSPITFKGAGEVKGGAILHGGVEVEVNPGGSVEVTPKAGVGVGELVKYSPTVKAVEWGPLDEKKK